jgi:hypothetical protein
MASTGFPLIVNKSHHVGGGRYVYKFGRSVDFSNIDIALGSCSIYYSWRNITVTLNNNSFQIIHPKTGGTDTLTITLPDGGYEISDINNYLRWYLITNGYYISNDTTLEQKVFCELRVNASTYSIEFVAYPTIAVPTGWTAGSAYSYDGTGNTPQLVVSSNNFGILIGYTTGTYPAVATNVLNTTTSTLTPVLTNVINVLLTLDCVDNPFTPNSNVIHALSSSGVSYGHLITSSPNTLSFIPCQKTGRQEIALQFVDQNMIPLQMLDYDVVVKLVLSYKV